MPTKLDLKREFHTLFAARQEPTLVDVPELSYLMIDGHGDPNTAPAYAEAVQAIYQVAYTLKFAMKAGGTDYGVMPLEGLWWVPDMSTFSTSAKSDWDWTLMILQPDLVALDMVEQAKEKAASKHPSAAIARVRLERFGEGESAQIMHIGPYAEEEPTIRRLHEFIDQQGLDLRGKHHEVYLGDPRRSAPDKLRTIIRQPVTRRSG